VLQFAPPFHSHEFVLLTFEQHHGDGHVLTLSTVGVDFAVVLVFADDIFQQQQHQIDCAHGSGGHWIVASSKLHCVHPEFVACVYFVGILYRASFSLYACSQQKSNPHPVGYSLALEEDVVVWHCWWM
jgi:hypothetical protein